MLIATFAFLLLQPLLGTLSDRIGRRTNLLIFSGGMTLFAVPLFGALPRVQTILPAVFLFFAAPPFLSFYTSFPGLFNAYLFPPRVAAFGFGSALLTASASFGAPPAFSLFFVFPWGLLGPFVCVVF